MKIQKVRDMMRNASERIRQILLMNTIKVESGHVLRILLSYLRSISAEISNEATNRGCQEITNLLFVDSQKGTECSRKKIMQKHVEIRRANIFKMIPKDTEYDYNAKEKLEMFSELLTGEPVSYQEMLEKLVVPQAHVGKKINSSEDWELCPQSCEKKISCKYLREVYWLAMVIKSRLGDYNHPSLGKIFKNLDMKLIGSMSEGTKIFKNDELDIHTTLHSFPTQTLTFDTKTQTLYLDGEKFPCGEYVVFFFQCVLDILKTIELPSSFSMLPVKTSYKPCVRCMSMTYDEPQPYRCHHSEDCIVHSAHNCKDIDDCPYECQCQQFRTPSISWSKIGAVLHLGSSFYI